MSGELAHRSATLIPARLAARCDADSTGGPPDLTCPDLLQQCVAVESVCGDASEFIFPPDPIVLYLFNPLPEAGLERVIGNLELSLTRNSRPVYVIYHTPLLERVVARSAALKRIGEAGSYAIYAALK